ncbi:MAG: hypothetical protein MI861_01685 [Pirellulales bacterium]|nr:hypothetical protein [Pirellulales bacterium]
MFGVLADKLWHEACNDRTTIVRFVQHSVVSSMHCVLIADIAALISQHGPAILYRRDTIPPEAVSQYWTSSRSRFELWHQAMARYRQAENDSDWMAMRRWWREHLVLLEEVFVTEMLTRVIAGLAAGLDEQCETDEISPVTHAIHLTHLESRNRVQQLMLFGRGNSVHDAVRLNRLRQGVERWTDAMIGRMAVQSPATVRYAIDVTRAQAYAEDLRGFGHGVSRETASWLMNAAMDDMLRRRTSPAAALPVANRNVAQSVMLMLRPDLFDSVGNLKSLWLHRLQIDSERTDRVLDELTQANLDQAATATGLEMTHDSHFERWYM